VDTSKSGWTPYVYYTTLYSTPRYANLKSGEIRVKDILGDPGADKGGEGKSKRAEKYIWHEEK